MELRINTLDRMPRQFPPGYIVDSELLDILGKSRGRPKDAGSTLLVEGSGRISVELVQGHHRQLQASWIRRLRLWEGQGRLRGSLRRDSESALDSCGMISTSQ